VSGINCYSIRRLCPLRSTIQVAQDEAARALSYDGINWQIQVLSEWSQNRWGSLNADDRGGGSYALYAVWSAGEGIAFLPRNPMMSRAEMEAASAELLRILPSLDVPFPPGDPYELWWLDTRDEPLALLASAVNRLDLAGGVIPRWRALSDSEVSYGPVGASHERLKLEQRVRAAAGGPSRVQWFRRDEAGRGVPIEGSGPLHCPGGLGPEHFPVLPLREHWQDPVTATLVRDYLDWMAPVLLTQGGFPAQTRLRLETAARRRVLEVDNLYRLYPDVVDEDNLKAALVEAALRKRA